MAFKQLSPEDIRQRKISAQAAQANEPLDTPGKKSYRVYGGTYVGQLRKFWLREQEKGAQEGRQYVSMLFALYDREDRSKFRGTVFADASWEVVEYNGKKDNMSRLFTDLLQSLGAPAGADTKLVLGELEDTTHILQVQEYFDVNHGDLLNEWRLGKLKEDGKFNLGWRAKDYIRAGNKADEANALQYISEGYESKGMVQAIYKFSESAEMSGADDGDDIPF
jgi:hypothetical protein